MESLLPPQTVQESWQTIARATRQYGRFVRQTGGMCHFGLVTLAIRPTPHTPDISIAFELPVEEIPREYWAAVWQGIREELRDKRPNENWAGLEILVIGGAYHPVDSNEISYRMAGREGVRNCLNAVDAVAWTEAAIDTSIGDWNGTTLREQFAAAFDQFNQSAASILEQYGFAHHSTDERSTQYVRQHNDLQQVVEINKRWHCDIFVAVGLLEPTVAWLTTGATDWQRQWQLWNGRLTQKMVVGPAGFAPSLTDPSTDIQSFLTQSFWNKIGPFFEKWPDLNSVMAAANQGDLRLGHARTIALTYQLGDWAAALLQLESSLAETTQTNWLHRDLLALKQRLQ